MANRLFRTQGVFPPPRCLPPVHSCVSSYWLRPRSVTQEADQPAPSPRAAWAGLPASVAPSHRSGWFSPMGLVEIIHLDMDLCALCWPDLPH